MSEAGYCDGEAAAFDRQADHGFGRVDVRVAVSCT